MILSSLWLVSLVTAATPQDQARRLHELRGRLGVGPAPRARSSVKTRLDWAKERAGPRWANLLQEMVEDHLHLRVNQEIGAEVRDAALEAYLPWVATRLAVETNVENYPWQEAGLQVLEGLGENTPEHRDAWVRLVRRGEKMVAPYSMLFKSHDVYIMSHAQAQGEEGFFLVLYERGLGQTRIPAGDLSPGTVLSLCIVRDPKSRGTNQDTDSRPDRPPWLDEISVSVKNSFLLLSEPLLDWIEQTHPDLTRYTFKAAVEAQAVWHRQFAETHAFGDPVPVFPEDRVIQTWPDGSALVQLRGPKSLKAEGLSMGHCVGGYWPQVREGKSIIWSLRSPTKRPLFTMEITPTGTVRQVQGPQDRAPASVVLDSPPLVVPLLRMAIAWKEQHAPTMPWQDSFFGSFGLPSFRDAEWTQAWRQWVADMDADLDVAAFLHGMQGAVRENRRPCLPDFVARSVVEWEAPCTSLSSSALRGLTRVVQLFSRVSGGQVSVSSVWDEYRDPLGVSVVSRWRLTLLQHRIPSASLVLNCTPGGLWWGISLDRAESHPDFFRSLSMALSGWMEKGSFVVLQGFDAAPREALVAWAEAVAEGILPPPERAGRRG